MIKSVKGEKLRNEKVKVTLEKFENVIYEKEFLSDQNGLIQFIYGPNLCKDFACLNENFLKTSTLNLKVVCKLKMLLYNYL